MDCALVYFAGKEESARCIIEYCIIIVLTILVSCCASLQLLI